MREILFRGKRIDNGEWVYGDVLQNIDITKIREHEIKYSHIARCFEVVPSSVSQYTGLVDRNVRRVFEGDIVAYENVNSFLIIHFEDAGFYLRNVLNPHFRCAITLKLSRNLEVIGNIHDNPELIGGENNE